jgi:ABC-type transporter Mla subunit MlaD
MPSGYAWAMLVKSVGLALAIVVFVLAVVFGRIGYAAYEKRSQQHKVAALVGDTTARLREALGASPTPATVSALDANLQAAKAPRDPELADAAELYIVSAREIARRMVSAHELVRQAAASRAALTGHMARAAHRNDAWLRDAVALKKRVEAQHQDLGITLSALDKLLDTFPDSEKGLRPRVDPALLLETSFVAAARKQLKEEGYRAHDELLKVRRFVP